MATVAPPSFFLLFWVLRTTSSAFPEEPGPLNFIPTEGIDLVTFSPSSRLLPRVLLAHVVMCEVWGLTLMRRVVSRQGEHMEEGHGVGCGGQTGSHTKGVDWCPGQGGFGLHSGMRADCRKGLSHSWLSHTHSGPQETELLTHSDFESPYQHGSLQFKPDLDRLQFNNIDQRFPRWVKILLHVSIPPNSRVQRLSGYWEPRLHSAHQLWFTAGIHYSKKH